MENLREYIARSDAGRRPTTRRRERDDAKSIAVANSNGLHTASAFFLAGTPADEREARMEAFWQKVAKFRDHDIVVVALAVGVADEAD